MVDIDKNNINTSIITMPKIPTNGIINNIFLDNQNIDKLIDLCDKKVVIYENTNDNINIKNIIFEYCNNNNVLLDNNYTFNSYTLYSFNPLIDANNLCNKLYKIKKHIKLATFIYKQEFCIFDIYNQLVIVKTIINKDENLFKKILFDEIIKYNNISINTYPKIIYSILYFSDLYKPKNYKLEKSEKYDMFYNAPLIYFKDISKNKIKINNIEKIIRKLTFSKLKNITDIIFLDYYAYKYKKKKSYSYPINIIYRSYNHILNIINSKCSTKKISFSYKTYDNMYIDDFRMVKTSIYAHYNKHAYLITNVYNNTSYEIIPCYNIKNKYKMPHVFLFNKFMILNIINLLIYVQNNNTFIINLLKYYVKYNKKYDTINSYNIDYVGLYKDINLSKKIYNTGKDINNYFPYMYEQMHQKLREFNFNY